MLRLTTIGQSNGAVRWRVEGEIVSAWGEWLEAECGAAAVDSRLELDLAGVVRVDSRGIEVLKRLRSRGAHLANCSPLILEILAEEQAV